MNETTTRIRPRPSIWKLLAGTLLLAGIALSPRYAHAAGSYTFDVKSTADVHDATPGNGICDTPPASDAHGACTLRAASDEAGLVPAGSHVTILLHAAQYKLTLGTTIPLTNSIITLTGLSSKNTIVGDSANPISGAIFDVETNATIRGMEITGGNGTNGGGIYDNGALVLQNVYLYKNTADYGGGIYKAENDYINPLTILSSTIDSNTATSDGGGIYTTGDNDTTTLQQVTIVNNQASGIGGGIYNNDNMSIHVGLLRKNTAGGNGGGIYTDTSGFTTATTVTFDHNQSGDSGGAWYSYSSEGDANGDSLIGDVFTGNTAVSYGGAIYNDRPIAINQTTVRRNTAGDSQHQGEGGGAYVNYPSMINNSLFDHNTAIGPADEGTGGQGGGLYSNDDNQFSGDTFSNNSAGDGAGMYEDDDHVAIQSSLFSGNHATHDGGGLYENSDGGVSSLLLSATNIHENRADHNGGGVFLNDVNQVVLTNGSAVYHNTAGNTCNNISPC
jgi:predicted outer membrane repeat protein